MTAFIELDSTMFRGILSAATGVVRFRLSASAVNVIDTLNIANGAVSYSQYFTFSTTVTSGHTMYSVNANIQDASAYLEVTAYSNRLGGLVVAGAGQNRHNAKYNLKAFPVIVVVALSRGVHRVSLTANSSGSANGWLGLRYIRRTGG